jgi:uroporphyrinogen decarboxylase
MNLSHKERIERILSGREVDRPAISAWRHFYHRENSRADLVDSMIEFQRKFDWDFVKINSRASYHIEDWGALMQRSTDPLVKPHAEALPISSTRDWAKIKPLSVTSGALSEILGACEDLVKKVGGDVYCLPTVFSPLSIAGDLVDGDQRFVEFLRSDPKKLHAALDNITKTFTLFVNELLRTGAAGIFFATTEWAGRNLLTEEEYLEFGKPYDLLILNAAKPAVFNILHVCNKNNMLPLFRDYPPAVLSWNSHDEGNLSVHQVSQLFDKIFLTGIDHNRTLISGSPREIEGQIKSALGEAPAGRLMIGPGCAVKVNTPDTNLKVAADFMRGLRKP